MAAVGAGSSEGSPREAKPETANVGGPACGGSGTVSVGGGPTSALAAGPLASTGASSWSGARGQGSLGRGGKALLGGSTEGAGAGSIAGAGDGMGVCAGGAAIAMPGAAAGVGEDRTGAATGTRVDAVVGGNGSVAKVPHSCSIAEPCLVPCELALLERSVLFTEVSRHAKLSSRLPRAESIPPRVLRGVALCSHLETRLLWPATASLPLSACAVRVARLVPRSCTSPRDSRLRWRPST
mmetsp:Transcript_25199/g.79444  ORF Transcript_25199/g.79444 Transcript_25199/m.79444 type:complete len:239 (+) Transcript_25199:292-1008(+)